MRRIHGIFYAVNAENMLFIRRTKHEGKLRCICFPFMI